MHWWTYEPRIRLVYEEHLVYELLYMRMHGHACAYTKARIRGAPRIRVVYEARTSTSACSHSMCMCVHTVMHACRGRHGGSGLCCVYIHMHPVTHAYRGVHGGRVRRGHVVVRECVAPWTGRWLVHLPRLWRPVLWPCSLITACAPYSALMSFCVCVGQCACACAYDMVCCPSASPMCIHVMSTSCPTHSLALRIPPFHPARSPCYAPVSSVFPSVRPLVRVPPSVLL